jgi:rubredoxin
MREFILLCHGNDFEKLTLLKIGDTVERLYEKYGSVDAVPVVHGRWVHHYYDSVEPIDDKWYCSECHMCNDYRRTWYCPNCGAKMDGGENDE